MTRIPDIKRVDLIKFIKKYGWYCGRKGKKHDIFVNDHNPSSVAIPRHKVILAGTVINILKEMDIPLSDFRK